MTLIDITPEIAARNTPAVAFYTKPGCVQCTASKRHMDKIGAEYTSIDLTKDMAAMDYVKSLDYMQAPVTVVQHPDGSRSSWYGYQPDLINEHMGGAK